MKGKKILLGITGSIAAYKAAMLVRLLVKQGAEVKVVMTPLAKEFITPLTMATLAKNPVLVDFFNPENGDWNSHVDLGLWADAMLIAPASANTMSKMAHGIADNLLLTSYLSAKCPVFIAPAMDLDMYLHPATQKSIGILKQYGNHFIEPESGELASGLTGKGRMAEPENIVAHLNKFFAPSDELSGKHFLLTAGPTFEKIDAVRFIGNFSSGKMGYAIANELAARGARVSLVSGPASGLTVNQNVDLIKVVTANDMYTACLEIFPNVDGAVMTAAVSDYRIAEPSDNKLKSDVKHRQLHLTRNPDIAQELGKRKKRMQLLVGFALETDNEIENARKKLEKKNFNFIVLNSLKDIGAGFQHTTNKITILDDCNNVVDFELKPKSEVAVDIVNAIVVYFEKKFGDS